MTAPRQYRAGQSVEDYCRQCHEDRIHTVIVVDAHAQPLRVTCDFCRSEHNYRGGPRSGSASPPPRPKPVTAATPALPSSPSSVASPAQRIPVDNDLEATIRRIIREETGLTPVAPAEKWRGGQLVMRPGKPGV